LLYKFDRFALAAQLAGVKDADTKIAIRQLPDALRKSIENLTGYTALGQVVVQAQCFSSCLPPPAEQQGTGQQRLRNDSDLT